MSRSTSRSVRYSRLRLPTVTFTEVGTASRSREFSMEIALPPVRTVTDLKRGVTDLDECSSAADSGSPLMLEGVAADAIVRSVNNAGKGERGLCPLSID